MVDKRKRVSGRPVHSSAGLPRHALLIRTLELLISLFYKKTPQDKLAHLKRWEREKVTNLGLAAQPSHPKQSLAKDVSFTSWDREKVSNFGLTASHAVKNAHRDHHQPKRKQHQDQDLTPKISPAQAWKKEQNQVRSKNENSIDDFFKILGYE